MRHACKAVGAIGRVTFLEILRDKVLYNIILVSALLFAAGLIAAEMAVFQQGRVVMDLGLSALSISSMMIAIFNGAAMIGREFERRTVFMALSRPITRTHFLLGKYFGLAGVLLVNWLLLAGVYLLIVWRAAGAEQMILSPALWAGILLALLQALMTGALAVLFSSFTTASLSVMFTIGLYLIGSNASQLSWLAGRAGSPLVRGLLEAVRGVVPNFEHFQIGTRVTYNLPISGSFVLTAVLYSVVVSVLALIVAAILIRQREA